MRPTGLFAYLGCEALQVAGIESVSRGAEQVAGAHMRTEQAALVDGLVGAAGLQFGRAVGGQQDQRNRRLAGFDHRRQPVGRRRSRGGQEQHRTPRGLGDAEGKKCRTTLVDRNMAVEAGLAQHGQRQRGRARAGGEDGVFAARRDEAGDQCLRPEEIERAGVVHAARLEPKRRLYAQAAKLRRPNCSACAMMRPVLRCSPCSGCAEEEW